MKCGKLADSVCREGKYDLDFKNPNSDKSKWVDMKELTDIYLGFIKEFPIVSIEDPFDQDHWEAWTNITAQTSIQVTYSFQNNFTFPSNNCRSEFNLLLKSWKILISFA